MPEYLNKSLGWLFGIALSVLFISLWGRVVVVDSDGLSEAVGPLAGSTAVADRFGDWLRTELVDSGVEPVVANDAVDTALMSTAVDDVLSTLVQEVVAAAASADESGASVDVGAIVAPAIPELASSLESAGASLSEDEILGIAGGLDPLVIIEPGSRPVIGPGSELAARLGVATVLAVAVLTGTAAALVLMADDRPAELKLLLERMALGGLSFAVLLRIGSWVLDPGGGRAPVSKAFSMVLGEHWLAPLTVGLGAAAGAAAIWAYLRRSQAGSDGRPGEGDEPDLHVAA